MQTLGGINEFKMVRIPTIIFFHIFLLTTYQLYSQDKSLFPEYDEVIHYNYDISDSMIYVLFESKRNPLFGSKPMTYLRKRIPDSLDQDLPKKLKKYGYKKSKLSKRKTKRLDSIFVQQPELSEYEYSLCWPTYRDFLIFRKKKKIVGIAQICFKCDQIKIVGNIIQLGGFGYYNEFKKLKQILFD